MRLRRAIVVLMAAQGQSAPDIAYLLKATDDYAHCLRMSAALATTPRKVNRRKFARFAR